MRILHVIEGLDLTSGVSLFCVEMCNRQVKQGHMVTLLHKCRYEYKPNDGVQVVQGTKLDVIEERPDVVHVHGLWSLFNVQALYWCLKNKVPYVVSPHGCLMPWAMRNGRVKKFLFFHFLLKSLMRKASCLHVTTDAERIACEKLGLKCKYGIVPLGVTMPDVRAINTLGTRTRTVLFLSRVSREKGVEILLDAWKRLPPTGWRLVVAGPSWRGYLEELKRKVTDEGIVGVEFIGAVIGEAKDKAYRSADLFILPSYAENFGSVVVEALSYGVTVIATKGTPWAEIEESRCGWWIENDVETIARTLSVAMRLGDSGRARMGQRGRKLVADKYTWTSAASSMLECYKEVLQGK
ncbi:MAG: glycosyltransferase [Kiritimatiellae bacterium]|nr:glycosyltransferase [Kiritimatiellia bacterium]